MLKQTRTTGAALRVLREALSEINHAHRADIGHAERVELMLEARRLAEQVQGLAGVLTAEVERHQSSMHVTGTPLTSMLATAENKDDKDAARSVFESRDMARHPQVADAIPQGATSTGHARGIAKGMAELPRTLDAGQRGHAEAVFLRHAQTLTPTNCLTRPPTCWRRWRRSRCLIQRTPPAHWRNSAVGRFSDDRFAMATIGTVQSG